VVGEFMSAIFTDESCENFPEEFAGFHFYPEAGTDPR
jgi:hypothetical protein